MYPASASRIVCGICDVLIEDTLQAHLERNHVEWTVQAYEERFNTIPPPQRGAPRIEVEARPRVEVTEREIEEHPGGREGAMVEKQIPEQERPLFREDILSLAKQYGLSLPVSFQAVQLAHLMLMARRCRAEIEAIRATSDGRVWDNNLQEQLKEWNAQINATLRDLEKVRKDRPPDYENPITIIQDNRRQAEIFVKQRLGELKEVCPECGCVINLPALPHWAFAPIQTQRGTQWMVWSQELWWLVLKGQIRLWQMAMTLRTSPEFIQITARRRGEEWPMDIDIEIEEALLRVAINARESEIRLDMELPVESPQDQAALPAPDNL